MREFWKFWGMKLFFNFLWKMEAEGALQELISIIGNDDLDEFLNFDKKYNVIQRNWHMPRGCFSKLATYISDGPSIICVAAYSPAVKIFNYLFENTNWRAEEEKKSKEQFPAKPIIHYAITGGSVEIINNLLEAGVDMKYVLQPVLEKGFCDLAKNIIDEYQKQEPNLSIIDIFSNSLPHSVSPIKLAIKSNDINTVKLVVNYYNEIGNTDFVKYDKGNGCALLTAAKAGDEEIFELIRRINEEQLTIVNKHKRNVFTQLIRKGKESLAESFFDSIMKYDDDILKDFLFNNKDDQGKTPLHYAVKICGNDFIQKLISNEYVNAAVQDNLLRTPIFDIVDMNDIDKLNLFLDNDSVLESLRVLFDNYERNPLHYVARTGWIEGLMSFVEKCPDLLDMKDISGLTPMMWAVINGENDFVCYWIENYEEESDIHYEIKSDVVTGSERNALHWAIIEENYKLTKLFIESGWFDLDKSPNDKTPSPNKLLESCRSKNMLDIVNGKFIYGDTPSVEEIVEQTAQTE